MDSSKSNVSHSDEDLVAQWQSIVSRVCPSEICQAYLKDLEDAFVALVKILSIGLEENPGGQIANELDRYARTASLFAKDNPMFGMSSDSKPIDFSEQIKNLNALIEDHWVRLVDMAEGLSVSHRRLLKFHLRQIISALSPDNWPLTNKNIWEATIASNGENFSLGLENLLRDLTDSDVGLSIRRCEDESLTLGTDIAPTTGSIVYQNELIQLIYYPAESSKEVQSDFDPILFVPPCINKFYILDLTRESSLVNWLVNQGADVYMISWADPCSIKGKTDQAKQRCAKTTISDYVERGVGAALGFLREKRPNTGIHLSGYCVGGLFATLTAAAQRHQANLSSLTLINTLLNYDAPGELGVFTSSRMIDALLSNARSKGYVSGQLLAQTFSLMKEKQLFWPALVNRYFLGKAPSENPLAYWNHDVANLSLDMMEVYLNDFYSDNRLWKNGRYRLDGGDACLADISVPVYLLACEKDHIVQCDSALSSAEKLSVDVRRVVASGGHVLGVLNPPDRGGGHYRVLNGELEFDMSDDSLPGGSTLKGSWWPDWLVWMRANSGSKTEPAAQVEVKFDILEPAPGSYVKQSKLICD